ncbi:MAG: membrane integrity-associated transporter subunit PqiC [Kordiimonadaceae bacterium]|nr:membrane integrity-associated transporter subunit PqiC [Kordiimonadaceae bacterium]MBO6567877.1 membrane integrity-associated transporter subunit PqiC [Kordiimonadaceae bacterium]MBO6964393.1 membrane integrity-associated transporter subunit PqiC [Kordiimonadaceae bacterium]
MSDFSVKKTFNMVSKAVAVSSLMLVAGCGPLISFGDDGPADQIFSLDYPVAGDHSSAASVIYVAEPLMSGGLSGTQVSVVLDDNQRTSLMGVRWNANTTDMVRDYLVRGLSAQSGALMLGEGALDVKAGCRLGVKVWDYEYVPGNSISDDRVDVEIELILVRYIDNALLGQPTFAASEAVSGSDGVDVVDGFNRAMASISRDAGDWIGQNREACQL